MEGFNLDPNMLVSAISNKDDGGLGGSNGLLWIFLLLLFGGNGFGGRNGEGQIEAALAKVQAAGASDQMVLTAINGNKEAIMTLANATGVNFAKVEGAVDSVAKGICDLGYKLSQDTASVITQVAAGNAELSRQLADCCCATQRGIDSVKYDIATSTAQLERYIDHKVDVAQMENRAVFQGIRDYLTNEKIEALQTELQSAQIAMQNNAQTRTLMSYIDSKCTVTCPTP